MHEHGGRTIGEAVSVRPEHPVVASIRAFRTDDVQLRLADAITRWAGSMPFVYLHIVAFAMWMLFLESSPWATLTLVVSLEAIFLSSFVMIGQNRSAVFQRAKAPRLPGGGDRAEDQHPDHPRDPCPDRGTDPAHRPAGRPVPYHQEGSPSLTVHAPLVPPGPPGTADPPPPDGPSAPIGRRSVPGGGVGRRHRHRRPLVDAHRVGRHLGTGRHHPHGDRGPTRRRTRPPAARAGDDRAPGFLSVMQIRLRDRPSTSEQARPLRHCDVMGE